MGGCRSVSGVGGAYRREYRYFMVRRASIDQYVFGRFSDTLALICPVSFESESGCRVWESEIGLLWGTWADKLCLHGRGLDRMLSSRKCSRNSVISGRYHINTTAT